MIETLEGGLMYILVINTGSSSVKFTLFDMTAPAALAGGIVERIGLPGTEFHYRNGRGHSRREEVVVGDTTQAVGIITAHLTHRDYGVIQSLREIAAVGHRVVHGGEEVNQPVVVDGEVKRIIEACFELAPLHNPFNLKGIEACEASLPGVPQVAVFDTAFHATIPEHAYLYGLPYRMVKEHRIRRYGFHGTSHKYVSKEAAGFLGVPPAELKMITCHLGNGCSITAVDGGRSVDTSMGFTPLEGVIMGTRCGDIDPAIIFYLMEHKHMGPEEVNDLLNKKSGLLGLADVGSSDLRDIMAARAKGNRQADAAVRTFCYRIKKYIGAYAAAMGGLEVIVFTAGIGENSPPVRELVCEGLGDRRRGLGIAIDPGKNATANGKLGAIHSDESRVKVLVVPTNEEKEIANQTVEVLRAAPSSRRP
jgi:acetate kinase